MYKQRFRSQDMRFVFNVMLHKRAPEESREQLLSSDCIVYQLLTATLCMLTLCLCVFRKDSGDGRDQDRSEEGDEDRGGAPGPGDSSVSQHHLQV